MEYKSGQKCTINRNWDLWMDAEAREFIGQPCEIVKQTKAGLVQVRLVANPKKVMSFPQRNVEVW